VHRWYEPQTGRYASADPLGLNAGVNHFGYAFARPLLAADPLGLAAYVCSRKAFVEVLGGIGNHGYFWDGRPETPAERRACGRGLTGPTRNERGPGFDECVEIPGSDGREDFLFECCERRSLFRANAIYGPFFYVPVVNDCQSMLGRCLLENGLDNPGAPGGRFGSPCNRCETRTDPPERLSGQSR